jgi:hypothetical protein
MQSFLVNTHSTVAKAAMEAVAKGSIQPVELGASSSMDLHWHRCGMPADEHKAYKLTKVVVDMHGDNIDSRKTALWTVKSSLAAVASLMGFDAGTFFGAVTIERINKLAATAPAPGSLTEIEAWAAQVLWMWLHAADSLLRKASVGYPNNCLLTPLEVQSLLSPDNIKLEVKVSCDVGVQIVCVPLLPLHHKTSHLDCCKFQPCGRAGNI